MEPENDRPESDEAARAPRPGPSGDGRLGRPTRLTPRRPAADPGPVSDPVPDTAEAEPAPEEIRPYPAVFEGEPRGAQGGGPFGGMFGPRSVGNGRVQVWGCSPGCLIASLLVSALLTLLLNALL